MITKTNTLLDAMKKPAAANNSAALVQPVNSAWSVLLFKSDKIDSSMEKLGGNDSERFRPSVDEFVKLKVDHLKTKIKERAVINDKALKLDKADRSKIKQYGHYHLKVGAESGLYALFYIQEIDSVNRQLRLKLSLVALHTDYDTKAKQARLLARMPTQYDPTGQLSAEVTESVERSPRRVLFSWLKR